ncbi:MAG: transporter [Lachnospiraceae bacterium]|nr:transporter [Lachnospiraceae bacterium]
MEYLGINGLFAEILQMLSLADLGFGTAMVYSFYKPLAEGDEHKIAALVGYYRRIYTYIALSVAAIGLMVVPFLDVIVNTEQEVPFLEVYYLLNLANTVRSYLFVYKTSLITADQKQYVISKYNAIWSMANVLAQILVLLLFKNYICYVAVSVIIGLANNIHISYKADQLYPLMKKKAELAKEEKKKIFQNIKSVFIYKLSGTLLNATDNTLISIMLGTIWVGYYSNYNLVLYYLNLFIGIIFTSVTASIGNLIVEETEEKRYQVFESLQVISYMICGIAAPCLLFLLEDFICIWLGPEFIADKLLLIAIVLNFYLGAVLRPIWSYREATGLYRKTKYVMLCTAALNLILSIWWGKVLGLAGIVFASAASRVMTYIWYEPYLLFKEYFKRNVLNFYWKIVANVSGVLALCLVCKVSVGDIQVRTWLELIWKAIGIGCISLLGMWIFYRKTEGFRMVLLKVCQVFGKDVGNKK